MTTVTIKIAPVERWCHSAAGPEFNGAIREVLLRKGVVSIITESMHVRGGNHGKFWMVEPSFKMRIDEEAGLPSLTRAYVCEHMLEMD